MTRIHGTLVALARFACPSLAIAGPRQKRAVWTDLAQLLESGGGALW